MTPGWWQRELRMTGPESFVFLSVCDLHGAGPVVGIAFLHGKTMPVFMGAGQESLSRRTRLLFESILSVTSRKIGCSRGVSLGW